MFWNDGQHHLIYSLAYMGFLLHSAYHIQYSKLTAKSLSKQSQWGHFLSSNFTEGLPHLEKDGHEFISREQDSSCYLETQLSCTPQQKSSSSVISKSAVWTKCVSQNSLCWHFQVLNMLKRCLLFFPPPVLPASEEIPTSRTSIVG